MCSRILHYFGVARCEVAERRPMLCLESRTSKPLDSNAGTSSGPRAPSCARQHDLSLFGKPCGVSQCLHYVLSLQVRIVGKNFFNAVADADHADDHTDGDSHTAYACPAAHDLGLLGYSIQAFHNRLFLHPVRATPSPISAVAAGRVSIRVSGTSPDMHALCSMQPLETRPRGRQTVQWGRGGVVQSKRYGEPMRRPAE